MKSHNAPHRPPLDYCDGFQDGVKQALAHLRYRYKHLETFEFQRMLHNFYTLHDLSTPCNQAWRDRQQRLADIAADEQAHGGIPLGFRR